MLSSVTAHAMRAGSWIMGVIAPYMGYIALTGLGAFGIVMYLYADEKDDHRQTSAELAVKTADMQLLEQEYRDMVASADAAERRVRILASQRDELEARFIEASEDSQRQYTALRSQQAQILAVEAQLAQTKADLQDARTTYVPVPEDAPISLAPPPTVSPPTQKEIHDAECNSTSYSEPVADYVSDRLRTIYENGVSLSD